MSKGFRVACALWVRHSATSLGLARTQHAKPQRDKRETRKIGAAPPAWGVGVGAVWNIYRDYPGILIVLIYFRSGMG